MYVCMSVRMDGCTYGWMEACMYVCYVYMYFRISICVSRSHDRGLFCVASLWVPPLLLTSLPSSMLRQVSARDALLSSYIDHRLDTRRLAPGGHKKTLHEEILRLWLLLIKEKHPALPEMLRYTWFLFGAVNKSLVIQLSDEVSALD